MVQGRGVDASLNDTGRKQAVRAYERLNKQPIDKFYASVLVRTHQTLEPFSAEFTPLDGFDEISWGAYEGVKTTRESRGIYSTTLNDWRMGHLDKNVGGGENPIQVMERQKKALAEVLKNDAETTLICMHGRAMRILLCWVLNYPLNYMDGFPHRNCSYYSLVQTNGSFFIKEFNETSHLDG